MKIDVTHIDDVVIDAGNILIFGECHVSTQTNNDRQNIEDAKLQNTGI